MPARHSAGAGPATDSAIHEEILDGFHDDLGLNGYLGFIACVLMGRGISSGMIFDPRSGEEHNMAFARDLEEIAIQESVTALAVVVGSSFLTGKESFVLYSPLNRKSADAGRQLIGATLIRSLSTLDLPPFPRGVGIFLLIRVLRKPPRKSDCTGFAVVDEDIHLFEGGQRQFRWRTKEEKGAFGDDNEYCWLLWTRDRLRV